MIYKKLKTNISKQGVVRVAGGDSAWGSITGNINNQTDLMTILNDKEQSLVEGNNIVLTPQGTNNTFINTADRLTIEGIIGKNGVLDIESETHFKNTAHFESAFAIDDTINNHSTTIEQQDTDLKIVNTNGNIDLVDNIGLINPRTLKTNQDKLMLDYKLVDTRLNKISIDHNLDIDPNVNGQWELKLLQSEIDPSDVTKGTVKIVPTNLSSYDLDHVKQSVDTINETIKELTTENEAYTIFQTFQGVESKGSENTEGFSFYGYIPSQGTIPLQKITGRISFGNIFDVDFRLWDGIFYNNVKIPWGNESGGITTTRSTFTSTNKHTSITLYKEKTRPSNNLNVDTLVSSYNVVWDSKVEAVSAGTNLKELLTVEEWNKIITGEYFIKAYTSAGSGQSSYQVDFEIQNVVSENRTWNIEGGFRRPLCSEAGAFTTCYGAVKINKTTGEVRFFVVFDSGLNINFDIRKIFIFKRAL